MRHHSFSIAIKFIAACALLICFNTSFGQNFPTKPLRIVVPYPAGGATDYVARLVGERLSKSLGQPVVVDNKSGAAGAIGVADVAKSEADGHTLLFTIRPAHE